MGSINHIDLLGAAQVHPSLQYQSKILSGGATTPLGLSNAILTRDIAWLNIFKNGGFQKWSNGTSSQPDNVVDIPGAGFSGSVARTTFAKNDNWFATPYSTIYTNDSGKAMGGQKTFTNLKAFTQYSVSIWVYATTGSSPIYLQTTGAFTNIDENSDTRKEFWLRLVGTFTTDATPTDVIVKFYNSTSSGHFGYYSRLVIVEGDAPVEFSPHPADLGFEDFISSAGYSPANIIKNGSFQDWSNGTSSQPDEFVDEGTPTVARDAGERDNWFDTPYAVKYTATGASLEGGKVTLSNLKANTFYAVSVRAKVTAGDTARLATTGADVNIAEETTSTSWVTLSGIFRTDGTPTDVVLKLLARFDGDIVWFDKLIVVQGENPLVFFPHVNDLAEVVAGDTIIKTFTESGHAFAAKDVVMFDGSNWVKAQADSAANAESPWVVKSVSGDNFTAVWSGYIDGLSGLSAGTVYFLDDDTAGLLTTTEPTDIDDVSIPILLALSASTGVVLNKRGMIVTAGITSSVGEDMRNLAVILNSGTPASQVDIDADFLQVEEYNLALINLTVDITASGVNGLDTGSEASDTWYSLWVIYKPSTSTVASLLSTSETKGGLTLPTDYTKARKVGHVRNGLSSNFNDEGFLAESFGDVFHDRNGPTNWDFASFITDGTWRTLSLASWVPPGATTVALRIDLLDNAVGSIFSIVKKGIPNRNFNSLPGSTQVANVTSFMRGVIGVDVNREIEYFATNLSWIAISMLVKGWWR